MVEVLTDDTFEAYINNHEIVVLDIYTVWCGPCKMQAAILNDLGKELDKRVVIAKIDADQAPQTSQKYQIRAIPTVILFKDGKPVKIHIGVWPKEELESEIAAIL